MEDLAKATEFFSRLGFARNEDASDQSSSGMVINGTTMLMLHAEPYLEQFTQSETADPSTAREVTLGLSADSRQDVDELAERAVAAGGRAVGDPVSQGPMYMRAFLDPDGHRWSVTHFDMSGTVGR